MATKSKSTTVDVLAKRDDESTYDYVRRMMTIGTDAAVTLAESTVGTTDDAARLATFEDRVNRSVLAGLTMVGRATVVLAAAPKDFAAAAAAVKVSTDGGEYLGRKYSTLRECYRLASSHTPEAAEAFVAAFREATGRNPESIRDYVKWATAKGGNAAKYNTVTTLAKRQTDAAEAAAKATAAAADRRKLADTLAKAGKVDGCPVTAAQWAAMPESVLASVAILAETLRVKRAAETRAANRTATAATAAAETGPTAKRASRAKVAS